GGGSSHITPFYETSLVDSLNESGIKYDYMEGYHEKYIKDNSDLIAKIAAKSANYDKIVLCIGLPDNMEEEGLDRKHMNLPQTYDKLVEEVAKLHNNVVVVLFAGSPVEMPWRDKVSAILNMYLAGSASGEACANILYGKVNPSGRLAESYPIKLADCNSYHNFNYDADRTYYSDSIYVGYRYYDITKTKVAYPFGLGLSYTSFEYSNFVVDKQIDIEKGGKISLTIKNIGEVAGSDVIQIYIGKKDSIYLRPLKELKAFKKVFLQLNEEKNIEIALDRHSFEIFDIASDNYLVESGAYQLY
ncbi:MAG TPA: glycoside hydrolase family 3 C-terminal domain-containing protein, partial [Clostridia bacterium]|nr:glycoside hydrolase family 3 C-terminal domain-containing protein [Clostridia bacterium]